MTLFKSLSWFRECIGVGLVLFFTSSWLSAAAPASYAELANRVFLRTAPNGNEQAVRLLANQTFEASSGYRTNRADYSQSGLPADQGLLVLASTDTFNNVYAWQTNRYLLTFTSSTNGTYDLEVTLSTVAGVQKFAGPFSFSSGPNIVPRITFQPSGGAYVDGKNISALSVGALGFDLTYQWFLNGTAVPGATLSSYAFIPMNASRLGDWHVVVSNAMGSVTSTVAHVEFAVQPVITQAPEPVVAYDGQSVNFQVQATGGGLNYEWKFNGFGGSYPNQPSITVTNVKAASAGLYSVRVFNNAGSAETLPVRLDLVSSGLNSTWQNRPWIRIVGSGDAVPGYAARIGPLSGVWRPLFNLRDEMVHLILRANSEVNSDQKLDRGLFQWREGALSTLVFTNTPRPGGGLFGDMFYPTEIGEGAVNFSSGSMYEVHGDAIAEIISTNTVAPGRSNKMGGTGSFARRGHHVAISSSILGADGIFPVGAGLYLYDGATLTRLCDDTTDLPGVMPGYVARATEDSVNMDEQTIVFSSISGTGLAGVYRSTYGGVITKLLDTDDLLPGMTNKVTSIGDVDVEGGMVFAVVSVRVSSSTQNMVVGFELDGTPRVLGTGDFLVAGGPRQVYFGASSFISRWTDGVTEQILNTAAILDRRRVTRFFDVEAHGDSIAVGVDFQDGTSAVMANFGRAGSGAPKILAHPQSVTGPETYPAIFQVAASGAGPLQYQWRHDGVPVAGGTNAMLVVAPTASVDQGFYDVVVTSPSGSATSQPAGLVLTAPPVLPAIHVNPVSVTTPVGGTVLLSVLASGAPPLTYLWRLEGVPVDGANQATLNVLVQTNARYSVVVGNGAGSVTSTVASITAQPIIVRQPEDVAVAVGGAATFSVEATGFANFRYQWLKDSKALIGQTNATLILESVQATNAGVYAVTVLATGGGSLRSRNAQLTVLSETKPVLGVPVWANGQLTAAFSTVAGRIYGVEFSPTLVNASWVEVQTFTGDGAVRNLLLGTEGSMGFYRLVEKP